MYNYKVIDIQEKVFPTYFKTKKDAIAYIEKCNTDTRMIVKGECLRIVRI